MPRLTHQDRRSLVAARQQQILQAAARVFAAKGFDRATVRDVAQEAGVADGSIYRYFKNKQDILVHLPRLFIEPPVQAFRQAKLETGDLPPPADVLQFVAQNIAQIVVQNHELVRVLLSTLPTMDQATRATYFREGPALAFDLLESYITKQQHAGVFRADIEPELAARILPGMVFFSVILQEILQPENITHYEYDRILPALVNLYLHGILNPEPIPSKSKPSPKKSKSPQPRARKQKIQIT